MSFDLAPHVDGGTLLVLEHRLIRSGPTMIGFGAGWHAHLEALQATLDGALPVDRDERYAQFEPLYKDRMVSAI